MTQSKQNPPAGEPSEFREVNKPALVSQLSHEVRTLLGGIIGINELLLASDLSTHQKQLAQTIDQSSKTLLSVLNDIVDLSRIELGSMSLESTPSDIAKLAAEVCELHNRHPHKQVKLHLDCSDSAVVIFTDPGRVKQLLSVLVLRMVNCIDKGTVELKFSTTQKSGSDVELQFAASTKDALTAEGAYLSTLNNPRESGFTDSRWLSLFLVRKITHMMGGTCGNEETDGTNRIWIKLAARVAPSIG
jgi:K+-sensing histidine kinase KdpD